MKINNEHPDFDEMKQIDIRNVDPNTLVDIHDVTINQDLPKAERIRDYVKQIKNPYSFKCGDVVVKITFSDTEVTLEEIMESYYKSL